MRRAQHISDEDRILTDDSTKALELRAYVLDNYHQAVAGSSGSTTRATSSTGMRQIC